MEISNNYDIVVQSLLEREQNQQWLLEGKENEAEVLSCELHLTGIVKAIVQHCAVTSWTRDKIVLTLDPAYKEVLHSCHEQRLQEALRDFLREPVQVKINIGKTNEQ